MIKHKKDFFSRLLENRNNNLIKFIELEALLEASESDGDITELAEPLYKNNTDLFNSVESAKRYINRTYDELEKAYKQLRGHNEL